MNRIDEAQRFVNFEFAIQFGIDFDTKNKFVDAMQEGGEFTQTRRDVFEGAETMMLLKLHRYLNWADKKLHSASFYIESKEEISEDLLSDFREGGV